MAQDIRTSINHLYKVKSRYPPWSIKYKNIKTEISNLKKKLSNDDK